MGESRLLMFREPLRGGPWSTLALFLLVGPVRVVRIFWGFVIYAGLLLLSFLVYLENFLYAHFVVGYEGEGVDRQ